MNNQTNPDVRPPEMNRFQKFLRSPWIFLVVFALLLGLVQLFSIPGGNLVEEIGYSEFLEMLDAGQVESVEVSSDTLKIVPVKTGEKNQPIYYTTKIVYDNYLVDKLRAAGVSFSAVEPAQSISISEIIMTLLSLAMLGFMLYYIFMIVRSSRKAKNGEGGGGLGMFSFGKSSAKQYDV